MKNRIQLKVCGMRDHQNILDVAALSPDFMGFIFYHGSKRFVGDDFQIPSSFPKQIKKAGVFVNEEIETVLQKVMQYGLDYVQLHGDEQSIVCKKLRGRVGVIKVFLIGEDFQFSLLKPYVPFVDYFMFDTKSTSYGGSGKTFDWNLLSNYNEPVPFFLSGGLNQSNIESALRLGNSKLFAIDINSGVESSPGQKDINKVKSVLNVINSNFEHQTSNLEKS